MKRSITFILFAVLCMAATYAQVTVTPEFSLGTNYRNNVYDKWNPTMKVGAAVDIPLRKGFSFETGLFYTVRSFDEITPVFSNESGSWMEHVNLKRHQLQLPLTAKYTWKLSNGVKLFCAAGGYVGYYIKNKCATERMITDYDRENANWQELYQGVGYNEQGMSNTIYVGRLYQCAHDFDWGVTGNVGVEAKNFVYKAGYDLSLGKESSGDPIAANYHSVYLSIGYRFHL